MKTKIYLAAIILMICVMHSKAQFVTFDPSNLVQSIVNTTNQVVETSTTAANMVNNFKETVKLYEQSKKYYDALKSVNNLVKDAKKVQQTVLMVGEISDMYVISFQKMLTDKNYTVEELGAIAFGYSKLLEQSGDLLVELKTVVSSNGLSMTDKERLDVIDRTYNAVKKNRNLVNYYTKKNIAVSYLRSQRTGDTDRVMALYGTTNEKYW